MKKCNYSFQPSKEGSDLGTILKDGKPIVRVFKSFHTVIHRNFPIDKKLLAYIDLCRDSLKSRFYSYKGDSFTQILKVKGDKAYTISLWDDGDIYFGEIDGSRINDLYTPMSEEKYEAMVLTIYRDLLECISK